MVKKKVFFHVVKNDDGYPPVDVESLWANQNPDGSLVIDSIPFFTNEATLGDTVKAISQDDALCYDYTLSQSGNSLLRVIFYENNHVATVRLALSKLGCDSELSHINSLISVNVPGNVSYDRVIEILVANAEKGVLDYEEAIIRH